MTKDIEQYILEHITPESDVLKELDRATHLSNTQARMLSGHLQGELLKMLVLIMNPRRVLELGTFTGYSAIAMARGLSDGAILHTIEIVDELESITAKFIAQAGLSDKIIQHFGNANQIIPSLCTEPFDLVFIDANKREYPTYYELLFSSGAVRSGSVILADNVLWSGKVIEQPTPTDKQTQSILEFNDMVARDQRVDKIILPLRDGLTVIRVK